MNFFFKLLILILLVNKLVSEDESISKGIKTTNIINIDVNGMVCDFCAQSIEKVFMDIKKVTGINVDLDNQKVVIYLKENAYLTNELINKLLEDAGYAISKINRES